VYRGLDDADLMVVPGTSHGLLVEKPELCTSTIIDFLTCFPDYAGSGGGTASREFVQRLAAGDRSTDSPASPRNVMNTAYWSHNHREHAQREEQLLNEVLKSRVGDDGYPGDSTSSPNWPGVAPGSRGILNALSGRYCDWSNIVALEPKPPVLWTHGSADIIVADGAAWEMGSWAKRARCPAGRARTSSHRNRW
jgi:hypothetical protein